MRILDLSKTIGGDDHRSIPFEGHPEGTEYKLINTHEKDGRTNATLSFNIHEGTHIDPPYHFIENGATIDEIPLSTLLAEGSIVRMHEAAPGRQISLDDFLKLASHLPEDLSGFIVIIDTAWDQRATPEDYYRRAPYLSQELADWFVSKNVRAIGLTNPPDKVESPRKGDAPIHRTLLGNDVLIIENLANLDSIDKDNFKIAAFPLKIKRGCGGPCRVVALLDD